MSGGMNEGNKEGKNEWKKIREERVDGRLKEMKEGKKKS